ncbi:TOL [Neurospora crassa OR74A]|uniref:TOL n=1 Tax=Neurospora crassa (strain ATCC 24698 / 74-OR23-1A / CBS 708.71 / DSM 1257 / FGSC 987) TaxID=367110 RepID=V5IL76_NEUCR|nr:TOL [Neurospora crassa OR74A]ESA42070.1 TOL [Neurospora crassa OR74A]|eukprot:XP_011395397.1 TOL [Neurospora crassa OR74A]
MPPTYTTPSGELHLSEKAFNRLCLRCDSMFKSIALAYQRANIARGDDLRVVDTDNVPFGTLGELLNSASKGECHSCCSWVAQVLVSESAHLITGHDMKPNEQVHPSLQPVVSQGVLLGTEIEPAIDTLVTSTGREKALCFSASVSVHSKPVYDSIRLRLDVVGEDGKPTELTNCERCELLPHREEHDHLFAEVPKSLHTGSEASLDQAFRWLENCVSSHPSCNRVSGIHENSQGKYPARFLDVGCMGSRTVKLTETTGMDFQKQRYMTLSHCWGDSVPARLLLNNYASRLKGFALDELPRTFQDAILLTQRLNVQFLWIDSLCIIQDSPDDWVAESAKMHFVYQNTHLNLAAAVSPNSSGGFFFPRHPLSFVPWLMRLDTYSTLALHYELRGPSILYRRGWVLQEQILPRRTLIFGRQELYWECSMSKASEFFPGAGSVTWALSGTIDMQSTSVPPALSGYLGNGVFTSSRMKLFQRERLLDAERLEAWASLVAEYSGRNLTKQSDKLVAISGLAEHLSNGWDGVTYLAGLWSCNLRENLLWRCVDIEQSKGRNTGIAPSWSWASLSAQCEFSVLYQDERPAVDSLAEILEAMVSPVTPTNLFGQVRSGGRVRIRGPLLHVRASRLATSTALDLEPKWRCDLGEDRDGMEASPPDLELFWDEEEYHGLAIIYLAPLQVSYIDPYSFGLESPVPYILDLQGLFLRPALTSSGRKGTFERLGVFEMSQELYPPNQHLSSIDSAEYEELMLESIHSHFLFPRLPDEFEKEKIGLLRSDPYLNGPLNTKLKHRYSPELEPEQYPELAKFLDCLETAAQYNRETDSPDENLGQDEGNGFYIYELV